MRMVSRLRWLLFVAVLAVTVLPAPALAQKEDLVLTVLPSNWRNEVKVGEANRLFLEIRNNGTESVTQLKLSSEPPRGWLVEFRPREISALGAGSVETVDFYVRPDSRATKGDYTVIIIAEGVETRKVIEVFLRAVTVLPAPAFAQKEDLVLTVLPSNWRHEVKVGEDNRLFLEIRNNSARPFTRLKLSSEPPGGWLVEFRPSEISSLGAGSVQTVDVSIRPYSGAAKGDYTVNIIAEAVETRKVIEVFMRVERSSALWLWVGALTGAVLIGVFVFIFVRSSRQKT